MSDLKSFQSIMDLVEIGDVDAQSKRCRKRITIFSGR